MITRIKAIIESMGIPFRYGNPSQINYYLNNVDYAAAPDGVAAYCYLLTDSEYVNGKERATIAVFFSKLISFDFNGSEAVSVTDDCKAKAKEFLHQVAIGNSLIYQDARFQYGYNDFAENVAWCAVRAVFELTEADCWNIPDYKPTKVYITEDYIQWNDEDDKVIYNVAVFTDKPTNLSEVATYWNYYKIESSIIFSYIWIDESIEELREYVGGRVYIVEFSVQMFHGGNNLHFSVGGVYSNTLFIQHT